MSDLPILYSFRRCPYAMRARLALVRAGKQVVLREILLRDKAPEFLKTSPKGTVPVMVLPDGTVLEESLDVMRWALPEADVPPEQLELVERMDAEFKPWLDKYKYPTRYENMSHEIARTSGAEFVRELEQRLSDQPFLFGESRGFADIGIAPFIRQFAHVDRDWFLAQNWPNVIAWYSEFIEWDGFKTIMPKYPKWQNGDVPTLFPEAAQG